MSAPHAHCPWCASRWWNTGQRVIWEDPWTFAAQFVTVINPCVPVGETSPGVEIELGNRQRLVVHSVRRLPNSAGGAE